MTDRIGDVLWKIFALAAVAFMALPLLLLVLFSFSDSPLLSFPIERLSLRWVTAVVERPGFLTAFRNSIIVAAAVGVVSTSVGTLAALALSSIGGLRAGVVLSALTVPIMVPPLMLGVMLLTYYRTWLDMPLGLHTVILSHLVFTQPFVILVVNARMATFDHAVQDSARDLGANPWQVFRTITLPIVRPSIIGAALIAMALSLDDFLVTFFTIGGANTLPTYMWGMLRKGVDPSVNVAATLIMLLSIGASVVGLRISRYRG